MAVQEKMCSLSGMSFKSKCVSVQHHIEVAKLKTCLILHGNVVSGHGPRCPLFIIIFRFVIMDSCFMIHIPFSFLQENDSHTTKTLKLIKLHPFHT